MTTSTDRCPVCDEAVVDRGVLDTGDEIYCHADDYCVAERTPLEAEWDHHARAVDGLDEARDVLAEIVDLQDRTEHIHDPDGEVTQRLADMREQVELQIKAFETQRELTEITAQLSEADGE